MNKDRQLQMTDSETALARRDGLPTHAGKCGTATTLCDWEAAREFLGALDPEAKAFSFQTFSDNKALIRTEKEHPGLAPGDVPAKGARARKKKIDPNAQTIHGALTDNLCRRLEEQNQRGVGVFLTINETNLQGRQKSDIQKVRAVWADLDNGLLKEFPLKPSALVNSSPGKYHAYWFIGDEMSFETFRGVEARLARDYGGDANAMDVARVLRLPGTCHMKTGKPHLVTVEFNRRDDGETVAYRAETIAKHFPPVEITTRAMAATVQPRTGTAKLEDVLSALDHIAHLPSDDDPRQSYVEHRATWFKVGCALKREYGDGGLSYWLDWSKQAGDVYDESDALTVWSSIRDDSYAGQPITVGSIFHWAQVAGWRRPAATLAVKDDDGHVVGKIDWPDPRGNSADPNSARNVSTYLKENRVVPWLSEFDQNVYLSDYPSTALKLTDASALDLRMAMHDAGLRCSKDLCIDRVTWEAGKNRKHPVRDYLDGLEWKRKPRLDKWLARYCGAEDNRYHELVGAKTLIAAVRRVRHPGCKFDTTLILEGKQGAKKSSALRVLAGYEWFTDGIRVGADPKETIELTCGKWIAEMAELSGMSRKDVNEVKQSLSKQSDRARLAYGRFSTEVQRQFILCGTTNNAQYLRDKTGNRRFWCVAVGEIDLARLAEDRDQLWAEAAFRESNGEAIFLSKEEQELADREQAEREEDDDLEVTLDDLLGDFEDARVPKTTIYKALGYESVARGSGTIGAKVLSSMTRRGWKQSRETTGATRQWCFVKGTADSLLCHNEGDSVLKPASKHKPTSKHDRF